MTPAPTFVEPVDAKWFRVGDDSVALLRDGAEALPVMLRAIASARREVLLEMYWVGDDACGASFREALADRAKAGVSVRVIYDAVGSLHITPAWWAPLVEAGGEVHVFHPLSPLFADLRWNRMVERDHRKILVIDGTVGFTGGINLSAEWLPLDQGGQGWRDDMVAVRGPTAGELRALFFQTHRRVTRHRPPADVHPVERNRARVWVLATRTLRKRRIHREYVRRIRQSRTRVDIANSYFIPDRGVRAALCHAVARGVKVRVLVPERGDVPIVHFAVEAMFEDLLRHGLEIYALPGPMLHAKTAIIDDDFTTIGSYNLDERSWHMNLEVNLAIEDTAFARHVRRWFERDLARSRRVQLTKWRTRSLGRRGLEWAALAMRKLW